MPHGHNFAIHLARAHIIDAFPELQVRTAVDRQIQDETIPTFIFICAAVRVKIATKANTIEKICFDGALAI
jgi:hypothetical protein